MNERYHVSLLSADTSMRQVKHVNELFVLLTYG